MGLMGREWAANGQGGSRGKFGGVVENGELCSA